MLNGHPARANMLLSRPTPATCSALRSKAAYCGRPWRVSRAIVPGGVTHSVNDGAGSAGEAAFMTGLERNSDIVFAASYAPLLQVSGTATIPLGIVADSVDSM